VAALESANCASRAATRARNRSLSCNSSSYVGVVLLLTPTPSVVTDVVGVAVVVTIAVPPFGIDIGGDDDITN
jgi:hypothetical protein